MKYHTIIKYIIKMISGNDRTIKIKLHNMKSEI